MKENIVISLDASVVKKVEDYAKQKEKTVTELIEDYLRRIVSEQSKRKVFSIDPLVENLCGVLELPSYAQEDLDSERAEYLADKYK